MTVINLIDNVALDMDMRIIKAATDEVIWEGRASEIMLKTARGLKIVEIEPDAFGPDLGLNIKVK